MSGWDLYSTARNWVAKGCQAIACSALCVACVEATAPNEAAVTSAQAITQPIEQSFELAFYSGADIKTAALLASGSLRIADSVRLIEASSPSSYAQLQNTGTTGTEVGAWAKVGPLVSAANVNLRSNATVYGDLRSAGKVDSQSGAKATGTAQQYADLGELSRYRFTVKWPAASSSIVLDPDRTAPISAGTGYNSIVLNRGAYVTLSAGQYYTNLLQLEPDATLKVDTRNGPVVLWVKDQLNYKGKVNLTGPDGAFLIGYLGSNPTSLEKALSASVVAPNATLRLAPIGSPGWRGSFFAKSIDAAEAGSTITHRAFDFWDQLLVVKPTLHCVRRSATSAAALFGYENLSDVVVNIPVGTGNRVTPTSTVTPPTSFQPGLQPRQFWVPFDIAQGLTWTLSGAEVSVNSNTPACQLNDIAPGDSKRLDSDGFHPIDVPGSLPPHLENIKLPNHITEAMSGIADVPAPSTYINPSLPSTNATPAASANDPSAGEDVALAIQAQTAAAPGMVSYTFKVTNYLFDVSEGLCGQIDPYAKIWIDGQGFGNGWEATAQIPEDKPTVHVRVEIWDDDDFLCGGDDLIEALDLDLSMFEEKMGGPAGGFFGIYWASTPEIQHPLLCMDWNAQFLDSGPWSSQSGTVGAEDFAATRQLQQIPASYAYAKLTLSNDSTPYPLSPLYSWTGHLDYNGCIPMGAMPPVSTWTLGTGLKVKLELSSTFCFDPSGGHCGNNTGVRVNVRLPDPDVPNSYVLRDLCQVFAENPDSINAPNCSIRQIGWTKLPPRPYHINFSTPQYSNVPAYVGVPHDPSTRAAAVVSHILKREGDTSGGLGVSLGLATRRYSNADAKPLTIWVDTYCSWGNYGHQTSCSGIADNYGPSVWMQPAGVRAEDLTRFKYAVAHEFGHMVTRAGMGLLEIDYGDGPGVVGVDPMCQCAHMPDDEAAHCLQSLELPSSAQDEGLAQVFSAKVWNKDLESDCVFVHGKHFLNDTCMPGVESCQPNPNGSGVINHYPIPVSCSTAVKWRNNHCVDSNSSPDLLNYGTEYDWLEFYYAITNNPILKERWTMKDIFDAYVETCGGAGGCNGTRVGWVGAPGVPNPLPMLVIPEQKSLTDGVKAAFGENSTKNQAFLRLGREYGVSNEL